MKTMHAHQDAKIVSLRGMNRAGLSRRLEQPYHHGKITVPAVTAPNAAGKKKRQRVSQPGL